MSSRRHEGDHSNEDAATTPHCPGTEDHPRWWSITTTAHPVWRSPLPARTCSRPWPDHRHAHTGLVTRFPPSYIAQFRRDWTAMLGYRAADQNGG